jgi:AraC-like DNA-binding protein
VIYEEYTPPEHLRALVATFWRFELEPSDPAEVPHVVPPDGTITLALTVRGSLRMSVVGPRLSALRVPVRRGVRYVGVRARPGAGHVLAAVAPGTVRDRVAPLSELSPNRAASVMAVMTPHLSSATIIERLEALVGEWGRTSDPPDRVVASMVGRILAMRGAIGVGKLGPAAGLSYRQALRRFQTSVGLSPKELARLVRVRWACIKALSPARPSWADVSIVTGFSDQSHLVREFSEIFGWPPALVREYLAQIEHVHVEM